MEELGHLVNTHKLSVALSDESIPTAPWPTPSMKELQEFQARMLKVEPNFMGKDHVVKNCLGKHFVQLCEGEWEGSTEQQEYMKMQWNRSRAIW